METITWMVSYVIAINLIGFAAMGIDKARARKHEWRISEPALFFIAIIGGSLGSIIGMYIFRHKTKHKAFKWGMPLILLIQIGLILLLVFHPGFDITII